MAVGLAFWIIMLGWLLFGFVVHWSYPPSPGSAWQIGFHVLLFVLLLFLGWSVFGPPIRF